MFRLAVGATVYVIGQHREIIRDDQIVFLIRPRIARHKARLMMPPPSVITIKAPTGELLPQYLARPGDKALHFAQRVEGEVVSNTMPISRLSLLMTRLLSMGGHIHRVDFYIPIFSSIPRAKRVQQFNLTLAPGMVFLFCSDVAHRESRLANTRTGTKARRP